MKLLMQDIFERACETFMPADAAQAQAAPASFAPADVVKKLKAVLKAVTAARAAP